MMVGDEVADAVGSEVGGPGDAGPWPMPAERLERLLGSVADLAESKDAKPRERVAAAKVLLLAARLNLDALEVAQASEYADVLAEAP